MSEDHSFSLEVEEASAGPRHGMVAVKNYKDTTMDWSQISYTGKVEKVQTQPDTGHTQVG